MKTFLNTLVFSPDYSKICTKRVKEVTIIIRQAQMITACLFNTVGLRLMNKNRFVRKNFYLSSHPFSLFDFRDLDVVGIYPPIRGCITVVICFARRALQGRASRGNFLMSITILKMNTHSGLLNLISASIMSLLSNSLCIFFRAPTCCT